GFEELGFNESKFMNVSQLRSRNYNFKVKHRGLTSNEFLPATIKQSLLNVGTNLSADVIIPFEMLVPGAVQIPEVPNSELKLLSRKSHYPVSEIRM
ncbi:6398_t:CDS:2, partial [Funneliformis caledonium]